jgi:predicted protein tyrosine phosphatase
VSGYSWARRHKREFSAVITIEDPDKNYGIRFHSQPHPEHLILKFVDLDTPLPEPYGLLSKNRLAVKEDIERAILFAKGKARLLIHCEAGVGRSAAVCFVVLCDRHGVDREEQALRDLLIIQPYASPNMHIIALGDQILMRNGKMIEVIAKWYSSMPNNLKRRELNRKAYLYA